MDLLSDERGLLDGFRRADPAALERIYRHYVVEIARFLRHGFRFTSGGRPMRFDGYHDPDELRDALQETFLSAFSPAARSGYDGLRPFGAYVQGIARNVVLARFRKHLDRLSRFRPMPASRDESWADGEEALSAAGLALAGARALAPDQELDRARIQRLVASFVSGLSEQQRLIVKLHFVEQLGQEATAEALEINRYRVRKQIRTIRKKLWRRLRREGLDRSLPFPLAAQEVELP